MLTDLANALWIYLSPSVVSLQSYLPRFLAGLTILIFGFLAAKIIADFVSSLLSTLRVGKFLVQVRVLTSEGQFKVWQTLFAQLSRWSVAIIFLVPAVETWGLTKVTDILNGLLLYLPNVFVAVIVGLLGFVIANLTADVVRHSAAGLDAQAASILAALSQYAILFFTGLVVLSQLGVAADLVRILFTGFVAMMALAGGLAFGLGGKDLAEEILKGLKDRLTK